MAIQRDTRYPGRFDNATPQQPQGAFKNRTTDASKDGSYLERDWLNDISAFHSSILSFAGMSANGTVDAVGASQYFDALQKISRANNKIKTSQFVVVGSTGSPIPPQGSTENYSIGDELALGWVAQTAVSNATKDANGNVSALSGTVRYTINKDESNTVGAMYGSVMNYDGSDYTQHYDSDTTGLSVGSDASTFWIDVDLSIVSGVVFGLSEGLGVLSVDSNDYIETKSRGFLLIESNNGFAKVYPDGSTFQGLRGTTVAGGLSSTQFTMPYEINNYQDATISASITTVANGFIRCKIISPTTVEVRATDPTGSVSAALDVDISIISK